MKQESIWAEAVRCHSKKELPKEFETDILIIGGGIAGITAAFCLRNSKKRVALIDRDVLTSGITKNTTGKLTFLQGLVYHKIEACRDFNAAYLYYKSQKEAIDFVEKQVQSLAIDCDFTKNSSYVFTDDENKKKEFEKEISCFERMKLNYTKERAPFLKSCVDCLKVEGSAVFHPILYLNGLIDQLSSISIFEHVTAHELKEEEGRWIVLTDKGKIRAKDVLICTHYPFFIFPSMVPFKTHMQRSYALASKVVETEPYNAISIDKTSESIRFLKKEGCHIIYGYNNHKLGSLLDEENNQKQVIDQFLTHFPNHITNIWEAQDIMTPDHIPFIGEIKQHLFLATGFNKWGMTNGTIAGMLLSKLVLGKKSPYQALFDPKRGFSLQSYGQIALDGIQSATSYIKSVVTDETSFIHDRVKIEMIDGQKVGVYLDEEEKEHKVILTCPHMGCGLYFNNKEKTWDCPCHGSRFDLDGHVIEGPSTYSISYKTTKD